MKTGNHISRKYPGTTFLFITPVVKGPVTRLSSSFVYNHDNNASFLICSNVQSFLKNKNCAVGFNLLQVCRSVPSFVFAVIFIPSFHVLNSLFKCLTPSGDGFHCLNQFRNASPLILFGRLGS